MRTVCLAGVVACLCLGSSIVGHAVMNDYNNDGASDLAVFDTAGGYWYVHNIAADILIWKNQWGWSTARPVPGDYNGDGRWDLAVFDTAGGNWYIKESDNDILVWQRQWGWSTTKPVPGGHRLHAAPSPLDG